MSMAKPSSVAEKLRKAGLGWLFTALLFLLLQPGRVQAADGGAGGGGGKPTTALFAANVVKKVFPNGLTLLIKPNYDHDLVAVNLNLRMGLLYEQPEQYGISSLMQRCLLYGGTVNREPHQIYQGLEQLGAYWDAGCDLDSGNLWLIVTKPGFYRALEIYFDLILHPAFAEWDLELGKKDRLEQLRTWDDSPLNAAFSLFSNGFFGTHPYNQLSIGREETISALTRDDLLAWHEKIYIPNNMVFSVVGNVNPDEVVACFAKVFGQREKGPLPKASTQTIPSKDEDVLLYQPRDLERAYLILGYPAPSVLQEDAPVMAVINSLLGAGGMGNRLFRELRDKQGLAYAIGTDYIQAKGPSFICAIMITAPENFALARVGLVEEFKRLREEVISPEELENTKKWLIGNFIMEQETTTAQGSLLGRFEALGYGYDYIDKYLELIQGVTPEDIQRVAKKYFNHYVLAVLAPEGTLTQ